jgi:hypothetical protein
VSKGALMAARRIDFIFTIERKIIGVAAGRRLDGRGERLVPLVSRQKPGRGPNWASLPSTPMSPKPWVINLNLDCLHRRPGVWPDLLEQQRYCSLFHFITCQMINSPLHP